MPDLIDSPERRAASSENAATPEPRDSASCNLPLPSGALGAPSRERRLRSTRDESRPEQLHLLCQKKPQRQVSRQTTEKCSTNRFPFYGLRPGQRGRPGSRGCLCGCRFACEWNSFSTSRMESHFQKKIGRTSGCDTQVCLSHSKSKGKFAVLTLGN
jgi:hypothetical protein